MDSVGEGGKIWENGIETCKISCMKQTNKKKGDQTKPEVNRRKEIIKIIEEIKYKMPFFPLPKEKKKVKGQ